ncbi:MAG: serine protease, partial [Mesorhizobium sp.]
MSPIHILRRHRVAALLGAALIVSPFILPLAPKLNGALAETVTPPVTGMTVPN